MNIPMYLLARLGVLPVLIILSVGSASAQTSIGKTIVEKLTAKIATLENSCASDIKKYCKDVTPGEGRMIYCMQAHEDKISPKCAYELGETAGSVQATSDLLKEGVIACKAEISGVCGKTQPGQGRIAACLIANRSTASKDCADAIQKVEAAAAQ
jgi:hypothetical protein